MVLMIDNYDSFTFNLVQYFKILGQDVKVVANDKLNPNEVAELKPDYICLSPGPGHPSAAGCCLPVIKAFAGKIPLLGVCLGHQCIAMAYGGEIESAARIMHGKTSSIEHSATGLYQHLPASITVARYHSLVVKAGSLANSPLQEDAWTIDEPPELRRTIMGLRHRRLPVHGIQFHPESIATDYGMQMLKNFIDCYAR